MPDDYANILFYATLVGLRPNEVCPSISLVHADLDNYHKRRGLDMQMGYCRKIFCTYLRINGIEQEVIDLLQGLLPRTVFERHYFRPDFKQNVTGY